MDGTRNCLPVVLEREMGFHKVSLCTQRAPILFDVNHEKNGSVPDCQRCILIRICIWLSVMMQIQIQFQILP
jgi:hypothetical protein